MIAVVVRRPDAAELCEECGDPMDAVVGMLTGRSDSPLVCALCSELLPIIAARVQAGSLRRSQAVAALVTLRAERVTHAEDRS